MDRIMEIAFKAYNVSDEDKEYLLSIRGKIRDICSYKPDIRSIGFEHYHEFLEEFDPNHCIRDGFGYEAIGQGLIEVENWIKLPSGAYALEDCIYPCENCPYGYEGEFECITAEKHL